MAEIKIYLTEQLHTEDLQEASRDLITQNLQVADKCTANLQILSPKLSSEVVYDRVVQMMDPYYVTGKIVSNWNKKEGWVSRMLVQAKSMRYPEYTDSKLGEHLYAIDRFTTVDAALGFLHTTEVRLKHLLSLRAPQQLSFLGYGAFAYAESRVLRKAVFNRIFLTNPKITSVPFNPSSN